MTKLKCQSRHSDMDFYGILLKRSIVLSKFFHIFRIMT
jgi:hypothetical protein